MPLMVFELFCQPVRWREQWEVSSPWSADTRGLLVAEPRAVPEASRVSRELPDGAPRPRRLFLGLSLELAFSSHWSLITERLQSRL